MRTLSLSYLLLCFSLVQSYLFGCYYDYGQPLVLVEQLPTGICTHVLLIGAVFVQNYNVTIVEHSYSGNRALQSMRDYRQRDSNVLKVIPSLVGDDGEWKKAMVNQSTRHQLIESLIEFARLQDIDGFDFDWEYPCGDVKVLFTAFINELRLAVDQTLGKNFLLTAAVGAGKYALDTCYEIGKLGQTLDWIHLMTYDYHTIFDKQTGYSSPLYAKSIEQGDARQLNTAWSAAYLVEQGVPKEKILLGFEGLGHTFQLNDTNQHDFAAPVEGVGYGGGWMTFLEYCSLIRSVGSHWDDEAKVNYTYYNDQWANVGDVRSAEEKARFIVENNYGGAFSFGLHLDDPTDLCQHGETFPIHRAVARHFQSL